MGIHRFFPWFKTHFGTHILDVKMPTDCNSVHVDNFMIDLNGVFHTSCQRVYKYGNFKPTKRLIATTSTYSTNSSHFPNRDADVFNDVCVEIERLLKFVTPKKRLYLAVDGVAPVCKQAQQRQRRFKSALESSVEFDSCKISPGTEFMHNLTSYLDKYIQKKVQTDPVWQGFECIFSDEKVPSEGEQKCLQFVRQNKVYSPLENYCIHGMDADLIMLALSAHVPQFYILRENIYESGFHFIDIKGVSRDLGQIMNWEPTTSTSPNTNTNTSTCKKFNPERAIDDFVFLCFVIGNDFLPHIPSIEIAEGGVDVMLEVYRKVGQHYGHLTRVQNVGVHLIKKTLEVFFYELATYEKGMFEEKMNNRNVVFFPHPILDRHTRFDHATGSKVFVDFEKFTEDYYTTCFPPTSHASSSTPSPVDIKAICLDYLEGMQWVITYYTKEVPCWNWCYKYNYAPLARDLAKYVKDFRFKEYELSSPNPPFQQLLSIMSPKSSALVPFPLSELMHSPSSPVIEFFPTTFPIDLAGKRKEWEGRAILPILDQDRIKAAYYLLISQVDPSLKYLNSIVFQPKMYSKT